MKRRSGASALWLAAILAAGPSARGQVKVGDDVSLNLSGNVAVGYSATYGDILSSHGFSGGGNGDLSGSYYSPQFLSFHFSPYLNQSRESSNFDSVTTASGFRGSANIFSGSHFPGWINYSRTYDGSSNYSVPGLGNYLSHGNSDSFGIGWSENIPHFPSLSIGYQQANGDFETFGSTAHTLNQSRGLNTSATYRIDGFALNGTYHYGTNDTQLPSSFTGNLPLNSDSSNSSYSVSVSHALPLHGTAQGHYASTWYDFTSETGRNSGTIDTADGSVNLAPTNKLNLDANVLYTDNLVGTLYQTVLSAGGSVQASAPSWSSNSLGFSGDAVYSLTQELRVIGRVDHRQQVLAGNTFDADSVGGVLSYFRIFLGGRLSLVQAVSRNALSAGNQYTLGLSSSASYSRSVHAWNLGSSFLFNQNQATTLVNYSTNSYSYSGSVGRPIRKFYWNLNAGGSKSSIGGVQGSDVTSQAYSSGLSLQRVGLSASYSRSSGNAIQTPAGLTPSPLPLPVLPSAFILYGGESYSFGAGGSPLRGLTFTGTFVKTRSNTNDAGVSSRNSASMANFYMQHRFRQLNFDVGFTRVLQGFSLVSTSQQTVNSYYFGVSRWFTFF
jgi:hypothetical protein